MDYIKEYIRVDTSNQNLVLCCEEDCNLVIMREDEIHVASNVSIKIAQLPEFDIGDKTKIFLKLENGVYKISYEYKEGYYRKYREGSFDILIKEKKCINISFTQGGLIVI